MTLSVSVENLSKQYRLGVIGNQTLYEDLNRWWAKVRGLPDPLEKIGEVDHGNRADGLLWALRDINFQLKQGEVLGVIGRNGAGKSTLLKILSKVTGPTTGQIKIKGRIASLLEVGTGFHPELTGRENIYLNGAILGMSRDEISRKFDEIISFSEVEKFVDTPVKRYSSGMYVRLAFAVAAHLDPEIMVVDEVLAVGDAAFQRKCLGKLSENAGEGRTVLFVSHNMAAINRLCSRAILLDRGKLIADGPAPEITAKYLAGVAEESGIRRWVETQAPGSEEVRLLEINIFDESGEAKSVFEVSEDIFIKLVYRVNVPNTRFRCTLNFITQGIFAFSTIEPTELLREKTGVYTSTLKVPAHLLTESEYTLNISIFTSAGAKKHYVNLREGMSFQVYDSMTKPSARGDYHQNMAGVVRPMLSWKTSAEPVD